MARGIFGTIAQAVVQTKATDISALTWSRLLGEFAPSKSGAAVSAETALQVSTVLACVRVLAQGVAQIPLKVYRERKDGGKDLALDHPLYKLLNRRPNEWMTSYEFRVVMMARAVLEGNAYAFINRAGIRRDGAKDKPVYELIPLLGNVEVKQNPDYSLTYRVTMQNGDYVELPRKDVLHIRGISWNGYAGMNSIQIAREAIGLAIATEETHSRMHANGAKPGGLISVDGELSKDTYERLKEQMMQSYQGLSNSYKTMVLDKGAKFTPFQMSGVDSQHLETRRFQIEEVCREFGVFPQMVMHSDKTSTFASSESFFQAHVTHTLMPWLENWQQVFARDLHPDENDIVSEFSVQGLLRGDHAARSAFYQSAIVNGYMTRNEVRALENMNPLDGLDEPLVQLNMATQAQAEAAATAKLTPTPAPTPAPDPAKKTLDMKAGRVLSAANEGRIKTARDELDRVLDTLPATMPDGG